MYVIGTAGHVDHGKSTLIEALTGIHPDRLAEEKAREMTIDLGFAWLTLGEGDDQEEVGVVDVPGHRDFIENMLAGVGGIDLAVLVIAADEGVMPQTKEHLAILDLLEVRAGVVALSKIDLVDDPDWLELVRLDIEGALEGTALAEAPIVGVSAKTGEGLPALRQTIYQRLTQTPPGADEGSPRMSIDRVFTLSGFGTVVTGTLMGGSLQIGDSVALLPGGIQGRVRGLQTHRAQREKALPGSRVAINLTGVDRQQAQRGQLLIKPGTVRETLLVDAAYRHLPDAGTPLKHNMTVKLFVGAAEVIARTRILGQERIEPGESGFIQLALRSPLGIVRGDRFILRRPSPAQTIGGGSALDPHPGRQHRRFRPETIARLEILAQGTPEELLMQALVRLQPTPAATLLEQSGLGESQANASWQSLQAEGKALILGGQAVSYDWLTGQMAQLASMLDRFHQDQPLRLGMVKEEARSRLKLPASLFNPLITAATDDGVVKEREAILGLSTHQIQFSPAQQNGIDSLMGQFENAGINSPSVKLCKEAVGEEVYFALVGLGHLTPISSDVAYTPADYERIKNQLLDFIGKQGRITASQARDLLATSRKYAIAWLEHLDNIKVTRRVGDERELV